MSPAFRLTLAAVICAAAIGCRRSKLPVATNIWLGPAGGCVATKPHPVAGTLACWGDIADGPVRPFTTKLDLGAPATLALGAHHACGIFGKTASCWGDGSRGQIGATASSPKPVPVGKGDALDIAVGGAHTCIRERTRVDCFGADDEGQLGTGSWERGGEVRAIALGEAHTCAAFARGPASEVVCRGRGAPAEPLLVGADVVALAAGRDHTCALLADRTMRCWGKNDAGQLGDGTRTNATLPVAVLDARGVATIAAGAKHTCALLMNRTVACWGDNAHHQLANGTTDTGTRPAVIVGLVGVLQITLAGDGGCARLDDGFIRCWGDNARHQLGDGSTELHTVPMPLKYR